MDIVEKALVFATEAHEGQFRKYTNEPYIVHPKAVMKLVESVLHDENMLCAALLHDTIEDCGVETREIAREFNQDVADLVEQLTDVSTFKDGNRAARKAVDRAHTAKTSPRAKTIKLADLIDNTSSIVKYDPDFAKIYLKEKALLLGVIGEGNVILYNRARAMLGNYRG